MSEQPERAEWETCTLCAAFGRTGHLALATAVCDTCGYDPYGYYNDDLDIEAMVSR